MARIVKLNVGGTRYETSISTIMQYPNSMLGAMIQKPREQKMIENGEEIFIDRNRDAFKYVLEYLRDGDLLVLPEGDATILKQVLLEAQFFMLGGLKAIVEKKLQVFTKDGWKIGDIVAEFDSCGVHRPLGPCLSDWIGTIVQFRTDGYATVRCEHNYNDRPTMRLVKLRPKQA